MRISFSLGVALGLLMTLAGCATSQLKPDHPLYASADAPSASVYFLRPELQRTHGIADSALNIELEKAIMLKLSPGEYVRADIKPIQTTVTIHSLSYLTTHPVPERVKRERQIDFEAGKTYYLLASFHEEEFRGLYFVPTLIDEAQARVLAKHMTPAGTLAQQYPLLE